MGGQSTMRGEGEADVILSLCETQDGANQTPFFITLVTQYNNAWKPGDISQLDDYRCLTAQYPIVQLKAIELQGRNYTEEIILNNGDLLGEYNPKRHYPEIARTMGNPTLTATFSHLNPNPHIIDTVYNNYVFAEILRRAGVPNHAAINFAYDNLEPGTYKPAGHILGIYPPSPNLPELRLLYPEIPYSLQNNIRRLSETDIETVRKTLRASLLNADINGKRLNVEELKERTEDLIRAILEPTANAPVDYIVRLRENLLNLIGIAHVPETPISSYQSTIADILEILDKDYGKPFYNMPLSQNLGSAGLLKGIDENRRRQNTHFNGSRFVFPYGESGGEDFEKSLPVEKIYDAIRRMEVVPTLPVIILALASSSQIPTIAGKSWEKYGPEELRIQAQWLGIPTPPLLTTEEPPLIALKGRWESLVSLYPIYMMLGREGIMEYITNGKILRLKYGI